MNFEKCPNCGGEIEKGTFRSRGGNFFLPKGEKAPFLYSENSMTKRNAILLPPNLCNHLNLYYDTTEPVLIQFLSAKQF